MDESWGEGKRSYEYEVEEEEDVSYGDDGKKKRVVGSEHHVKKVSKAGGSVTPCCQVDNCNADLSGGKQYHKRHKVCENHSKAHSVIISEMQQRFCQQCSRFHELSEFDELKRSCRRRLAGHNERRRKNASEFNGEGIH
ncbi:unnamed protein product [Lathyrus oleraceus]|uniref:Squamosa promoter-binding-like protein n=1 Tax=Pisum sativum TaxID=3888 RepID=A0A9D5BR36_PEA|nr:squamosa promoter-binding protein 1-like [Pisum sativum]KAI5447972.1 hypothetical protein KIW84_015420 [Pisum sativum]